MAAALPIWIAPERASSLASQLLRLIVIVLNAKLIPDLKCI